MDHDTYMAKLAGIRAELYEAHLEAVRDYPGSSPRQQRRSDCEQDQAGHRSAKA